MTQPAPRRRVRVPAPVLPRRLPSGRGATEQPNASGDGDAELSLEFWLVLVLTGVFSGLFGDLMMLILRLVQRVGFGYDVGTLTYLGGLSFEHGVEQAPELRRLVALLVAGALCGGAWYLIRRYTPGAKTNAEDEVWTGTGDISFRRGIGVAVFSEVAVGLGASLGREAAPRLLGAACGSALGRWRNFTPAQRRLLVACGAGAGLAAVYNLPLAGALFIAEVLWGSIALPVLLPALACCAIATLTAWLYLPHQPTYVGIPQYSLSATTFLWAVLAGPVIGFASVGYVRLIGWVVAHRVTGRLSAVAPLIAFGILGLVAFRFPQLLGNGKGITHQAFLGDMALWMLLAMFILKPLATALCLGSGASGGLFTPTLATGATLGGFLGGLWAHVWPGAPPGAYALLGGGAMMGAAMQAPLTGIVAILELTHSGLRLMLPLVVVTLLATLVSRYLDGYSIYSARLAARTEKDTETAPAI